MYFCGATLLMENKLHWQKRKLVLYANLMHKICPCVMYSAQETKQKKTTTF
jgi:hypothetical protein